MEQLRQRVQKTEPHSRGVLIAIERAYAALLQVGDIERAKQAADDMLMIARGLDESPESLRDLSVSLFNLAELHVDMDKLEAARRYFADGLRLAHRLALLFPNILSYTSLVEHFDDALLGLDKKQPEGE